jgi:hypothetical protein
MGSSVVGTLRVSSHIVCFATSNDEIDEETNERNRGNNTNDDQTIVFEEQ